MESEYITLDQAARLAGYTNPSNLRTAARVGRLKTVTFSPRMRLTTQAWLNDYLVGVRPGNYKRGQQRKEQNPGEAGE